MSDETPAPADSSPLEEVGRYQQLSEARTAALALAAKDLPYSIDRVRDGWSLRVDRPVAGIARAELETFAAEEQKRPPAPVPIPLEKVNPAPLFLVVWVLVGFFFAQQWIGRSWTEAGAASSGAIVEQNQWWRTITALTLHGDLSHLVANLATGILFGSSLQPLFGGGVSWLLVLATGVGGNWINAWLYRGQTHNSIGASTAVFGALGLLVGAELWARWDEVHTRSRWTLVVPVGAGLALLAFLGTGSEGGRVDVMAHWWGFAVGVPLGVVASAMWLVKRPSKSLQMLTGCLALAAPGVAWWFATRG